MREGEPIKPDFVKPAAGERVAITKEIVETCGIQELILFGERIIDNSSSLLSGYLKQLEAEMQTGRVSSDGIKTGFGIVSTTKAFTIPQDIIQPHIYALWDNGEQWHAEILRLGQSMIDEDESMTCCLSSVRQHIGYADRESFVASAGYGELLAEEAARLEFDHQSAQMLNEQFGAELGIGRGFGLDFNEIPSELD